VPRFAGTGPRSVLPRTILDGADSETDLDILVAPWTSKPSNPTFTVNSLRLRTLSTTTPGTFGMPASTNALRLIARCSGAADIVAAVDFGRANDLLTAIRGGGHNVGGRALCDDGLVIALSAMPRRGRRVDSWNATK